MSKHPALENIVFIFGDGRSGNTFLSNEIHAYTHTVMPPENQLLNKIFYEFPKAKKITSSFLREKCIAQIFKDIKFSDWELKKNEIQTLLESAPLTREEFLIECLELYCKKHAPQATAIGIQKDYIELYPWIVSIFPNAKFLWLVRDGRAVFHSKSKSTLSDRGHVFETNAQKASCIWRYKNTQLEKIMRKASDKILQVQYENLIADTESTMKKITIFLNLNKRVNRNDAMKIPDRYGTIHENVGKPGLKERATRWENGLSEKEIAQFEAISQAMLKKYGYTPKTKTSLIQRTQAELHYNIFVLKKKAALFARKYKKSLMPF